MTDKISRNDLRIGSLALIAGACLNMVRMGPIYMHKQVGFSDYPPASLAETVSIAQLSGYYVSHVMVFFATPLFLLGFYAIYRELQDRGANLWLTLSWFGFLIGQLCYTLGVSIHGLILPEMAHEYAQASSDEQMAMAPLFELNHLLATGFGGLGFAFILVSTGIFGVFLRAKSPVLGLVAMAIGVVALAGYSFGVFEFLLFNNFGTTAGYVTIMFVFYFVLGFYAYVTTGDQYL